MPIEITESQNREYQRYQQFGTPEEVDGRFKKLETVLGENKEYRAEIKELKGKVPGEDTKVLTGDDAKRWDAFQALGKTPEELAAGLVLTPEQRTEWEALEAAGVKATDVPNIVKERDELKAKDAQRSRMDTLAAAVEAMGWPKETAAAIADMKSLDEASFEVKVEKGKDANGAETETKVAYVTPKGGQATKFADFASQNEALKGIRTTKDSGEQDKGGNGWNATPTGGSAGGYDPIKAGREMAERAKASKGESLALT